MSKQQDYKEVLYTIDTRGRRKWVYTTWIEGALSKKRRLVAYFLIAFYLVLPWLTFGGKQAVLLDIAGRKFTFFGLTLWATDTLLLACALAIAGLSLFFFTSVAGRLWCGWACPETVFLEFVFRPIERWIEGGPVERQRLDEAPWSGKKILKKGTKHALCAGISWVIASSALAYFYGREPLIAMMSAPPWENWQPFLLTVAMMLLMAFQFGWFREQFCTVLCPYARFQSVLMDTHSLGVGYDPVRGEPRGKAKDPNAGDCVDCKLCVKVCPTGIDIRNGSQLECIHCSACIDACNSVMEKLDRDPGLIRYDTEARLLHGDTSTKQVSIRTLIYGLLLTVFLSILGWKLLTRSASEVKIVRGPLDAPYHEIGPAKISNHLHMRISNRGDDLRKYQVKSLSEGFEVLLPSSPYPVAADSMVTVPLFVNFPLKSLTGGRAQVRLELSDNKDFRKEVLVPLLGPG